jgi:hypothetical protein
VHVANANGLTYGDQEAVLACDVTGTLAARTQGCVCVMACSHDGGGGNRKCYERSLRSCGVPYEGTSGGFL